MRQPLIKEFMVRLDVGAQGRPTQQDCEPMQKGNEGRNKRKKRTIKCSKYTNPCPDNSDKETPVIRFPPSPRQIISKYIVMRKNKEYGGVIYWEWKAG